MRTLWWTLALTIGALVQAGFLLFIKRKNNNHFNLLCALSAAVSVAISATIVLFVVECVAAISGEMLGNEVAIPLYLLLLLLIYGIKAFTDVAGSESLHGQEPKVPTSSDTQRAAGSGSTTAGQHSEPNVNSERELAKKHSLIIRILLLIAIFVCIIVLQALTDAASEEKYEAAGIFMVILMTIIYRARSKTEWTDKLWLAALSERVVKRIHDSLEGPPAPTA